MSEKGIRAEQLFLEGYNCSQSVVGAFCEDLGLDFETAMMLSSSFGGGMGRLREVCGAVSGMFMIIGLKYGYSDPKAVSEKAEHYARIQKLAAQFTELNDSIICRELLELAVQKEDPNPSARTQEYYDTRPCPKLVHMAADLTEAMLSELEKEKK